MTKRSLGTFLAIILCLGMTAGCGSGFTASESTVYVQKNGTLTSVDVEAFDTNTYDEQELKKYVEQTISDYNKENGKNQVTLKKLTVKDDVANLTLEYKTAADYRKFSGIDFFAGTLAEALAAGYSFDADFAAVKDNTPVACSSSEFINDASYKVVIVKDNTNVKIKGEIAYLSTENTKLVDESTVSIREGNDLLGKEAVSDSTQAVTEAEGTQTMETQISETEGSVSEDDLLNASQEDSQMVFDFGEENTQGDSVEFSQTCTYIIYR